MMRHSLSALLALAMLASSAWAQAKPGKKEFALEVQRHFKEWDRNHDGKLSDDEIDRLVTDPNVKGREAAAVAALEQGARSKKFTLPPLTCDYLMSVPAGGAAAPDFERMFSSALNKITKTPRNLFGAGKPRLDTIHQGRMGDCFFIAPLGGLVHRDAEGVVRMVHPLPDGRYEIRFPAGGSVRVQPLTDAELALGASNEGEGLWVTVMEKAFAEARNAALAEDKRKLSATDLIASGGSSARAIEFLTGHEARTLSFRTREAKDQPPTGDKLNEKLAQLRPVLKKATAEKRLAAAGTPETVANPGMKPKHAYAILAFDEKRDVVTLWNPHGNAFKPKGPAGLANGWPIQDGKLDVPLAEFVQAWRGVSWETEKPKKAK